MTLSQLSQEAKARGLDLGSVQHDKSFLINLLGDGSASVISLKNKVKKTKTSSTATKSSTVTAKSKSTAAVAAGRKSMTAAAMTAKTKALTNIANTQKPKSSIQADTAKGAAPARKSASVTVPLVAAKATAPGASKHPRISEKLTLAQLKDEAVARNMDPETLPKLKSDLLELLVDGSIHLKETPEYKNYHAVVQKMANERPFLTKEAKQKKQAKEAKKSQQEKQVPEEEHLVTYDAWTFQPVGRLV
jgi:hypothetical protein